MMELLRSGLQKCFDPLHDRHGRIFLEKMAGILQLMGLGTRIQTLPLLKHRGRKHRISHAPDKEKRRVAKQR